MSKVSMKSYRSSEDHFRFVSPVKPPTCGVISIRWGAFPPWWMSLDDHFLVKNQIVIRY